MIQRAASILCKRIEVLRGILDQNDAHLIDFNFDPNWDGPLARMIKESGKLESILQSLVLDLESTLSKMLESTKMVESRKSKWKNFIKTVERVIISNK